MPPRLGSLRSREVIRALQKAGYYIHETSGSHVQLKHPEKRGRVTVPNHQRFDLPRSIVKSIIKQAGLTNEQFAAQLEE
jgi:predicted RNA binding protein YcfA (HicA-like mRNA interferase family)